MRASTCLNWCLSILTLVNDDSRGADASEQKHVEAWELAKTWDEAVKERGGLRFRDISGMKTLEKFNTFTDMLFPFQLYSKEILSVQSVARIAEARADTEQAMDEMLCEWGS